MTGAQFRDDPRPEISEWEQQFPSLRYERGAGAEGQLVHDLRELGIHAVRMDTMERDLVEQVTRLPRDLIDNMMTPDVWSQAWNFFVHMHETESGSRVHCFKVIEFDMRDFMPDARHIFVFRNKNDTDWTVEAMEDYERKIESWEPGIRSGEQLAVTHWEQHDRGNFWRFPWKVA